MNADIANAAQRSAKNSSRRNTCAQENPHNTSTIHELHDTFYPSRTLLKIIALLLIALVIELPFHASGALAANIEFTSIESVSGIDGYRKMQDNTTFTATAYLDDDTALVPQRVRLNGVPFSTCVPAGIPRSFTCTTKFNGNMNAGPFTFAVQLLSASGSGSLAIDTQQIIVDGSGASASIDVTPTLSRNGSMRIRYEARDRSHTGANTCVGIQKIEFFEGGYDTAPFKTITPSVPDCSASGEEPYQTSAEGEFTLCIRATDRFGQADTANACDTFIVDRTAPEPLQARILDTSGNALGLMNGEARDAFIYVNISGNGITNTIRATIANINDNTAYTNIAPSICTITGTDILSCVWRVSVHLQASSTPTIEVSVSDSAGNSATVPFTLPRIEIDSMGPEFIAIRTDRGQTSGGGYYVSSSTTYIADIKEEHGLSAESVFLDLSALGLSATRVADTCEKKNADNWECRWNALPTTAGTGTTATVRGSAFTSDTLGNPARVLSQMNATVDVSAPAALSLATRIIKGNNAWEEYLVRADRLELFINVTDTGEYVIARVNTTQITPGSDAQESTCETSGDGMHKCVLTTDPITISGPLLATLHITLTDNLGNEARYRTEAFVTGLIGDSDQNFWTNVVSCSPKKVDREVTTLGNGQRVYCAIHLTPLTPGAEILSTALADGACTPLPPKNDTSILNYITAITPLNLVRGETNPMIKIDLATVEMKIDSIDIRCPLTIFSKVGESITDAPETEYFDVHIPFYSLPLGDLRGSLIDKYNEAKDDATGGFWKVIEILGMIVRIADVICRINSILQNLIGIYQTITDSITVAEEGTRLTPAGPGIHAQRVAACTQTELQAGSSNTFFSFFDKFCQFINCKMNRPDASGGFFAKWGSWLGGGVGDMWIPQYYPGVSTIQKWTGKGWTTYMNPRDSLAMSVLTFCLPGIIYNVDKLRQIKCAYAACLKDAINNGVPASACESLQDTLTCKYVFGEIFQLIPFIALFDYYINAIKRMLSDPFAIVGAILAYTCIPNCVMGVPEWPHRACRWFKLISMIGEVINDVSYIIDKNTWQLKGDYCRFLDDKKSTSKQKTPTTDTDRVVVK